MEIDESFVERKVDEECSPNVLLPRNLPGLCIPRISASITRKDVFEALKKCKIGFIGSIDIAPIKSNKNEKLNLVFVHMKEWANTEHANKIRNRLLEGKDIKIATEHDPVFWKASCIKKQKKTKKVIEFINLQEISNKTEEITLVPEKRIESEIPKKKKLSKRHLKIPIELEIMEEKKRYNEEFIELMEKLNNIMLKQGEPFRARAYQKAQETIMTYSADIFETSQLKGLPGIGSTIMNKSNEYVEKGTLQVLEREKTNPINILGEIYGVGPKKAQELVNAGIKKNLKLLVHTEEVLKHLEILMLLLQEQLTTVINSLSINC